VILGNPPYNAGQVNENDNNKNRKYKTMDKRVSNTYGKASKATLVRKLNDPYVKAIRWASDRLGDNGIVAFISNSSFIYDISFDGMRKHLAQDFNRIYVLDLKGDVRRDSMRDGIPIGEKHTIFGLAAMVGIAVTFFIKNSKHEDYKIFYKTVDWKATREEKFALIDKAGTASHLEWQELTPDNKQNWLTEGLSTEFDAFIPMGTKEAKRSKETPIKTLFKIFSLGVATNRDEWVYDFKLDRLQSKVRKFIRNYNSEVFRYTQENEFKNIDNFVNNDPSFLKWTDRLKTTLKQRKQLIFEPEKIRVSLYRPFTKSFLYFDHLLNQRRYQQHFIFPTPDSEKENQAICATNHSQIPFLAQMVVNLPCLDVGGRPTQCFPFYTYDENGSNRRENITNWALEQFRTQYNDPNITKWDIFYYVYAILHHPQYREKYAANLKRELPHIPFVPVTLSNVMLSGVEAGVKGFWTFAKAGEQLADLHVNYEQQPEYPLHMIENDDVPLNWRVEKMKLSKDKTQIIYNDFLTLGGIPPEAFEYRLGNRSALDWIIDQYRVKTDKRSGITNDPNRTDEPDYIVNLIQRVITVSVETVKIVKGLPEWEDK
jgi:predicted helicase